LRQSPRANGRSNCETVSRGQHQFGLFLLRSLYKFAAKENGDISDAGNQVASGLFRQLRRELFLLVLEIVKFDLDEFLMLKGMIHGRQELRGQTVFPHPERGFHPLCPGFEIAHLCIAKRTHDAKLHPGRAVAEEFLYPGAITNSLAWSALFGKAKAIQRNPGARGLAWTHIDGQNQTSMIARTGNNWDRWCIAGVFSLLLFGGIPSSSVRAESVGEKVEATAETAKEAVSDAGKTASKKIEELWARISEARLKNRTRDEIVAWVIMGVLVGGLMNRVTGLKPITSFSLGLLGAFVGGIVAHVTALDFGLGPVLIRYEDLVMALVGAAVLMVLGKLLLSRKKKSP